MKTILFTTLLSITSLCYAQNIGINGNGNNPHPSALLDVDAVATPSLGILIPRIALQAINLSAPVSSPATSLLVYNTASASTGTNAVSAGYYYWDGAKWVRFAYNASGSSSTAWDLLGNAGTSASTNFIGTTDNQDLVFKRNNVQAGLLNDVLANTSFGINALNVANTGSINTAIGYQSLANNTTGYQNVATGYQSLKSNTTGFYNVAIGVSALANNTIGDHNVAIGNGALFLNTTGNSNTATGSSALGSTSSGSLNTASGVQSLAANTTGNYNTAHGAFALYSNTTADNNIAFGYSALYSNTTGANNVAIGNSALNYNTTGNQNTAIGHLALYKNTVGIRNIANGWGALYNNTTGNSNSATGFGTLFSNTTGSANTAQGFQVLYWNTTGGNNTANGYEALALNTTGNSNAANGFKSLGFNTTGSQNVANGLQALYNNTTGNNNTANGSQSLYNNTTAHNNVADGTQALYNNTIGTQNTAVGGSALINSTSGDNNTAIGYNSGSTITTGHNNTFIGVNADATAGTFTNATAIGYNAKVGQSNALILGGTGGNAVNVGIGTTTPKSEFEVFESSGLSEIRISSSTQAKYGELIFSSSNPSYLDRGASIEGNGEGTGIDVGALLFKTQYGATLRTERMRISSMGNVGIGTASPVYKLDVQGTTACAGNVWTSDKRKKQNIQSLTLSGLDIINKLKPVTYEWKQVLDDGMKGTQMGFIAQELEAVLPSMVVTANDEEQCKAVKYNELLPLLVKAIQELGKENIELKKMSELQQKQIEMLLSK